MSFQQGLSGLNASSKNLSVIGNNIANANTYGAKASRAEFADMYAASLNGTGTNNIGIGTNLVSVAQQFTQGNITTTENPMDLAINGNGFFQLTNGDVTTQYSRNGQFKVDNEGYFVNNAGYRLVGRPAGGADVGALRLPPGGLIDPRATTRVTVDMNIDARSEYKDPALVNFDDATTYNGTFPVTVYDNLGQSVAVTFFFQKNTPDPSGNANVEWNVFATANGVAVPAPANAGDPPTPVGQITFTTDGVPSVTPLELTLPAIDPGGSVNSIDPLTLDLSAATQFGRAFSVADLTQDGYAPGKLTSVTVEADGNILARYSNGLSESGGQVILASFRNPQGLQPMGDNMWALTSASGAAVPDTPGEGNLGVLQAGALEESNVDLTGELVNMITAQRVYQANAQTIKTQDQVLQTLVNLR
jgi:flagellar hook protein FlgE